jgi:predicted ABC-type sugar transport system permease subunit
VLKSGDGQGSDALSHLLRAFACFHNNWYAACECFATTWLTYLKLSIGRMPLIVILLSAGMAGILVGSGLSLFLGWSFWVSVVFTLLVSNLMVAAAALWNLSREGHRDIVRSTRLNLTEGDPSDPTNSVRFGSGI